MTLICLCLSDVMKTMERKDAADTPGTGEQRFAQGELIELADLGRMTEEEEAAALADMKRYQMEQLERAEAARQATQSAEARQQIAAMGEPENSLVEPSAARRDQMAPVLLDPATSVAVGDVISAQNVAAVAGFKAAKHAAEDARLKEQRRVDAAGIAKLWESVPGGRGPTERERRIAENVEETLRRRAEKDRLDAAARLAVEKGERNAG